MACARVHVGEVDTIVRTIAAEAREGDVVVVMSNGGFGGIHEKLLTALERLARASAASREGDGSRAIQRAIAGILPSDRVHPDEPLAPHTTFRVGGAADWLVDVRSAEGLRTVLEAAGRGEVPVTLLGGGSNVARRRRRRPRRRPPAADARRSRIQSPDRVRAEAGVTINGLVRWTICRRDGRARGLGRDARHRRRRHLRQRALRGPTSVSGSPR